MTETAARGSSRIAWLAILAVGLIARIGYVLAQPTFDPAWNRPGLDGAYYVSWARGLAGEGEIPGGAFYLAPLYPYLLGAFFRVFGENFILLFLLQEAAIVATAGLLGRYAMSRGGRMAGLVTTVLALGYHPTMFFAARPVGETIAMLVTSGALAVLTTANAARSFGSGALAGLGALARPNILLVPLAWAALDAVRRRWREALVMLAAVGVVLAPSSIHNYRASGHFVPISSNGGITLFHGNGPGATGGFTFPRGLSGRLETQREEATAIAVAQSGKQLDAVQADAWWGAAALRARLDDPVGTIRLMGWRLLLFLDNYELGLDYSPAMDGNPWRFTAPVPFAVLVGLAAGGVAFLGLRGTGGSPVWCAIAAAAAAPLLFYSASRYRYPAALLLCVPAGLGATALYRAAIGTRLSRRVSLALVCGALTMLVSMTVPSGDLARAAEAGALSNLADALQRNGDFAKAERAVRLAIERDAEVPSPRFQLGVILEKQGRQQEAEQSYREALALDAGHAAAAANLARLLVARNEPRLALPVLQRALVDNPADRLCWMNLVVALALSGERQEAIAAWHEARQRGVAMDDELLKAIREAPENNVSPGSE